MSEKFEIQIPSYNEFLLFDKKTVPDVQGVYIMFFENKPVKIGQTISLKRRLSNHEFLKDNKVDRIIYLPVKDNIDRLFYEMCYHYRFLRHKIKFTGNLIKV